MLRTISLLVAGALIAGCESTGVQGEADYHGDVVGSQTAYHGRVQGDQSYGGHVAGDKAYHHEPTAEERTALFALVRDNPHPVSQSLYENLLASGPTVGELAGPLHEEAGLGVVIDSPTGRWSLGRPGWRGGRAPALVTEEHDTELARDGQVRARFRFSDTARPGARQEIDGLRAMGLEVFILSGDRQAKVTAMAAALGLPPVNALGECTAEAKAEWLRTHDRRDTLMLGDGANDTLAFGAAFARGTPVIHRGVLESRADFYYLGRGLAGLRRLFTVNAMRRRSQTWLLVFSIAYNAVAVSLAAAGHMSPLLAAILMPASSLVTLAIVGSGMRGARSPG